MDKMEWSQAKSIAARIYGDAEIDGDLGDDGDTKSDREKQDAGDSKSGVKTIKTLIETEDEELDRIIEDMLAVLPRVEEEYLVSGARLKCSLATKDIIFIDGVPFHTNKNGTSLLKVENRDKIGDMSKANICDCEKQKNIIPFGNCKAELSEDEKKMLKANAGARQEGICCYLMNICGPWENEPVKGGMEYFQYHGYPGINGMSKLFCYKKGKIMAMTSGQENRNLSVDPKAVTKEDLQFALRNGISGEKIYALADIRDYFAQNPKLLEKTTIFAFEGLADEHLDADSRVWNGQNKYHMNGQFGAIMLVAKEGKLTYYEAHASTLPDNMETAATICEGIYEVKNGAHSKDGTFEGYAALWLNNSENIPAYNSIHQNDAANGIHFHMAGILSKDNPVKPYSAGCITIPVKDYVAFGKHVGFINEETDENIGSDNVYGNAKSELKFSEHTKAFEGYIVIDRQYYDDTEGYLKFNGSEGEE